MRDPPKEDAVFTKYVGGAGRSCQEPGSYVRGMYLGTSLTERSDLFGFYTLVHYRRRYALDKPGMQESFVNTPISMADGTRP